ncbi:YSIRK family gram-positive signal peptide [Diaporthe helianthi]|uniref:YSIRK family gram-positive signal peptide n=1 Tax=Diaporthe helianthi TaxID=158607 RepID=A0A2P5I5I5_DIAHE|nr:YSIRK family gram-positive signal peptide [Diaporthe helianthi]
MAPLSSEPRQVLVVLNPVRRRALFQLVTEITAGSDDSQAAKSEPLSRASSAHAPPPPGRVSPQRGSPPKAADTVSAAVAKAKAEASVSQAHTPPSPGLVALRKAAIVHFDEWKREFHTKLREILAARDDDKILEARSERQTKMAQVKAESPGEGEDLIDFGGDPSENEAARQTTKAVESLRAIYHPIPTRLTTVPVEDRKEVVSAVLILLLSTGKYTAYARTFITYLTSALELPLSFLTDEEKEIAKTMIEASAEAEKSKKDGAMSAEAEAQKRKQQGQVGRFWKVGLASVAGAAIIGVTGGLAAPVVAGAIGGLMGSVGLGGLASFLGIFWMNGALVGTLFGAFGARMTGEMADKYAREVEDFRFLPLKDEWGSEFRKDDKDVRRLRVSIGINGWLLSEDEVTKPWRALGDETEAFALRYEMNSLLELGHALQDTVASYAWSVLKIEILKRTVLATLWAALWPIQILKLAAGVDNPFNLAKNRSEKAGRILADALINKIQGERPVTLIGYSLGARVIYVCLKTLAERRAFGLVDTVVFIGAPTPSNRDEWQLIRSVVTGKLFNVYSENDYILAFLYRATSIQLGIAGLQAVEDIEGVENLNLTEDVKGHLRYPGLIAQILTKCGFPNISGGEKQIEKEEDIRLEDMDGSIKTGTLLDFDEPPVPVAVKPLGRKTHREISFPSGFPKIDERPVVRKVQSTPAAGPLSSELQTAFDPQEPKSLGSPVANEWQRSATETSLHTPSQPPPSYSPGKFTLPPEVADKLYGAAAPDYEDDEEEDFGGGISMMDNDDDHEDDGDLVTYMEPLRLEDRDEKS